MPGQSERVKSVRRKLNPIELEFRKKIVLLVDDSIVRGTTSKQIIQMARDAGAKKVYFASAAPPVRFPNVYGIDMPAADELVAHGRTEEEVQQILGADWLIYQDLDDLDRGRRRRQRKAHALRYLVLRRRLRDRRRADVSARTRTRPLRRSQNAAPHRIVKTLSRAVRGGCPETPPFCVFRKHRTVAVWHIWHNTGAFAGGVGREIDRKFGTGPFCPRRESCLRCADPTEKIAATERAAAAFRAGELDFDDADAGRADRRSRTSTAPGARAAEAAAATRTRHAGRPRRARACGGAHRVQRGQSRLGCGLPLSRHADRVLRRLDLRRRRRSAPFPPAARAARTSSATTTAISTPTTASGKWP